MPFNNELLKNNSADGLKKLNEYMESRSYITGYQASGDDVNTFSRVNNPDCSKYPHVARWYNHIACLTAVGRLKKQAVEQKEEKKGQEDENAFSFDDDDDDVAEKKKEEVPKKEAPAKDENAFSFDDDDEDEEAAEKLRQKKVEEAAKNKPKKEERQARSTVVLDVKPLEAETDLDELQKNIRAISQEGLLWGACEKIPVAFGIKKLRILCTIVDDLVSVDDLQQDIEALEGCQSTDIYSFNKV